LGNLGTLLYGVVAIARETGTPPYALVHDRDGGVSVTTSTPAEHPANT